MTNNLISTSYIISMDELAFFKSLSAYQKLGILGLHNSEPNIVRDAAALMNLETKGFIDRLNGQLSIEPTLATLLLEMCEVKLSEFEIGETIQGKHLSFTITPYPLQTATYRITLYRSTS